MSTANKKIVWTENQKKAINTLDKTLLVSAAAGSGKTATLTERIIRSLTNKDSPGEISKMLISTFTRASAADLKLKISKALTDALEKNPNNTHLSRQLIDLGSAQISTIDSFFCDVVKKNFNLLSMPKMPKLVDEKEIFIIENQLMEDLIEDFYLEIPDFSHFMNSFTSYGKDKLAIELFINVYEKLRKKKLGVNVLKKFEAELEESSKKDFFQTKHGMIIKKELHDFISHAFRMFASCFDAITLNPYVSSKYGDGFKEDMVFFKTALEILENSDYSALKAHYESFPRVTLKGISEGNFDSMDEYEKFSAMKDLRTLTRKKSEEFRAKYLSISSEEISISFKQNAKLCNILYTLLTEFDTRLNKEKESRGICNFDDMSIYVYRLFIKNGKPTPLAREYANKFSYIYIDEYQDVNEIQDALFKAISTPTNRFMVGDIKQSIYGFRDADPSIFARYKKEFPLFDNSTGDALSIFMSENFRCDKCIVDFSNTVSSFLFSARADSIEYTSNEDLKFSKSEETADIQKSPVVVAITGTLPEGVELNELSPEEKEELSREQIKYITSEIKRLVDFERLANGDKITYKDIAVIARGQKLFPEIAKELSNYNIPSTMAKGKNPLENPEVLLVLALLSTIDNPQRDVSLAGTLRSPFFNFDFEDIYNIKSSSEPSSSLFDALVSTSNADTEIGHRCKDFLVNLEYWRTAANSLPCYKLIKKLYTELSVLSYSDNSSEHLLWLYESALKFESGGFKGLYGFISYINDLIDIKAEIAPPPNASDTNCVRLMTMHASKGLEFPVCFIVDCDKTFNIDDTKKKIVYDTHLGIGFKPGDESGFGEYTSIPYTAISSGVKASLKEEEMRLLYVAMTRARERLYVVANEKKPSELILKLKNSCKYGVGYTIMSSNNYLSWILASLNYAKDSEFYRMEIYRGTNKRREIKGTDKKVESTISPSAEITRLLQERFSYTYPYEHISSLPAKLSVSKLYPEVLDDLDVGDSIYTDADFDEILSVDFDIPNSLDQTEMISAAERGTATHAFLQFCNFDRVCERGIGEELSRLIENKFLPKNSADIINKKQLERFFESQLFSRIRKSQKIWREQRFNIFLPAEEFTAKKEKAMLLSGETIMVQGVIDIFFEDENGKVVLCDYKTDYLSAEEIKDSSLAKEKLSKRHKEQLKYYNKAITEILGKAPDEVLIYSLPLGEHITIELD